MKGASHALCPRSAALAMLLCALLPAAAPAQDAEKKPARTVVAEGMVIDLKSSFFRALLSRPFPNDRTELDTVAFVFDQAGHRTPAYRLRDWQERRDIKALLGERFNPPGTVEEAISSSGEDVFELKRRALRAILSIEPVQSDGSEVTYPSGPIRYLGNSVWRGGQQDKILWVRVRAQNHYTGAIEEFEARMRHSNEVEFVFRCKAEKSRELAPKRTAVAVCLDNLVELRPQAAIDRLTAAPLAIGVTEVRLAGRSFGAISVMQSPDPKYLQLVQQKAREMLQGNPCEALLACAQVAKRAAEEAARNVDWRVEQERRRERSAQRKEAGRRMMTAGLIAMAILTLALAAIGRSWQPAVRGFVPSILAAWTVIAGMVVGLATSTVLVEGDGLGYGGFFVMAVWMYGSPVLLLGVILLGIAMLNRQWRTVLRMGSLGFGLSAAGLTIATWGQFFTR